MPKGEVSRAPTVVARPLTTCRARTRQGSHWLHSGPSEGCASSPDSQGHGPMQERELEAVTPHFEGLPLITQAP